MIFKTVMQNVKEKMYAYMLLVNTAFGGVIWQSI